MVKQKKQKINEDIVDDVLRRVIDMAPSFNEALASQIARQVRHDWAGDTSRICYIARREDDLRSARNDSIARDYLAGERIGLLSRRYGLSERHILRILKFPDR